jgi:uncharacterized membrane protein
MAEDSNDRQREEIPPEFRAIILALSEKDPEKAFALWIQWKGPLPPPQLLAKYDEIMPGLADRLTKMAELQLVHRTELEKNAIPEDQRQSKRGQLFAFILALTFLVAAFILIVEGKETPGTIIGSVDLVALVTVFITGRPKTK